MRVAIFGATGMVGQGVLRECLLADSVTSVLTVGRSATGQHNPKLRELVPTDLTDLSSTVDDLTGLDACFFCLGVSAVGMSEEQYRRIIYDLTLVAATVLASINPELVFVYVSGAGTNAKGRAMWARVKGETENAVLALPLRGYAMRPGFINPMHGIQSRTGWYRRLYAITRPLYPGLKRLFPRSITSTEQVGQTMLRLAEAPPERRILEGSDINDLAAARGAAA